MLEAPDAVFAERVTGRRMDPESGEIYNLLSMPPPADAASRLVVRPADADAQAFALRLGAYAALQKSITPFFEAEGFLVRLNAGDDAATMHSQLVVATAHPVTNTASRVLSADDGDDSMPVRGVSASMDPAAAPLLGVELGGSEGGSPDIV